MRARACKADALPAELHAHPYNQFILKHFRARRTPIHTKREHSLFRMVLSPLSYTLTPCNRFCRAFASTVRQCVAGFFVTASSLKLLSSKTVALFGSSAPLISSFQFESTFFALMSES